jgi:hypothetical protein
MTEMVDARTPLAGEGRLVPLTGTPVVGTPGRP